MAWTDSPPKYLTVGGGTVTVFKDGVYGRYSCDGCKQGDTDPAVHIHRRANEHANQCRAIPA